MATYSNNTTIKVLTGVTLNGNASYTVPAGAYAIIGYAQAQSSAPSAGPFGTIDGGWGYLAVDGRILIGTTTEVANNQEIYTIYVPPGKVITTAIEGSGKNPGVAYALITVFQNTP